MFTFLLKRKLNKKFKKSNLIQLINAIGQGTKKLNDNVSFTISEDSIFFINHKFDHKIQFNYSQNENKIKFIKECYFYNEQHERKLIFSINDNDISNDKENIKKTKMAESLIKTEIFKYSHILLNT
jgi:hypothetical protein